MTKPAKDHYANALTLCIYLGLALMSLFWYALGAYCFYRLATCYRYGIASRL